MASELIVFSVIAAFSILYMADPNPVNRHTIEKTIFNKLVVLAITYSSFKFLSVCLLVLLAEGALAYTVLKSTYRYRSMYGAVMLGSMTMTVMIALDCFFGTYYLYVGNQPYLYLLAVNLMTTLQLAILASGTNGLNSLFNNIAHRARLSFVRA